MTEQSGQGLEPHEGIGCGQGKRGRGVPLSTGKKEKTVLIFSKNAGFCAFLLRKTTCDQKSGPGGLMEPLGAEDEKNVRGVKI